MRSQRPLCANPRCHTRNRHTPGCGEPACTGCQPRPAADGARLCLVCTERIAEDAVSAAVLHTELAERLMAGSGTGERVAGTTAARIPNPDAVEARADIEHFLTWWTRLICRERGHTRPADDAPATLGAFIAKHHLWLAAHRWAHYAAVELHELAHGAPRRIAYPAFTTVPELPGWRCPQCGAQLRAVFRYGDTLLPAEVFCDGGPVQHTWPAHAWGQLRRAAKEAA